MTNSWVRVGGTTKDDCCGSEQQALNCLHLVNFIAGQIENQLPSSSFTLPAIVKFKWQAFLEKACARSFQS